MGDMDKKKTSSQQSSSHMYSSQLKHKKYVNITFCFSTLNIFANTNSNCKAISMYEVHTNSEKHFLKQAKKDI